MRDLYKLIKVHDNAPDHAIEAALRRKDIDESTRSAVSEILLRPERRQAYDRCHHLLKMIGQLRAELDLTDTAAWRDADCADYERRNYHTSSTNDRRTTKPAISEAKPNIFFDVVVGIIVFALIVGGLYAAYREVVPAPPSRSKTPPPRALPTVETPLPLPPTKVTHQRPSFGNSVTLVIQAEPGAGHVLVHLLSSDTQTSAASAFVREGESVEVRLLPGSYLPVYAAGRQWYGERSLFGKEARYVKWNEPMQLLRPASRGTIKLNAGNSGTKAVNRITQEQFLAAVTSGSQLARSPIPPPLPPNGEVTRYTYETSVAPLGIRTRPGNGHYYVKLVRWGTNTTVLTVFIREGQSIDIDVPLGSYEIRYAVGKTWWGPSKLFGPDTSYARADSRFDFESTYDSYTGYTLELFLQRDGNLHTEAIRANEF